MERSISRCRWQSLARGPVPFPIPASATVQQSWPQDWVNKGEKGNVLCSWPACPGMLQSLSTEQQTSWRQHRVARRRVLEAGNLLVLIYGVRHSQIFPYIAKSGVDVPMKADSCRGALSL